MFDTPLTYVELHSGTTLFLQGNLGTKLGQEFKPGIKLDRASSDGSVRVRYQGKAIILERTSVFSWIPADPTVIGLEPTAPLTAHRAPPAPIAPHAMTTQNDALIQQARAQAMGQRTAQVWNPSQPETGLTKLSGPPKYIPHAPKPVHEPFDPSTVKHLPPTPTQPTPAEVAAPKKRGRPAKVTPEGQAS